MTSFANLPAAAVAAAASAYAARRRKEAEDTLSTNFGPIYAAEALARLAAASGDGMVAVDADDFGLIAADMPAREVVVA